MKRHVAMEGNVPDTEGGTTPASSDWRCKEHPPALLAQSDYYGTLAAARCLGRAGVPVHMAESRLLASARWSRYVKRTLSCPNAEGQPERFMTWLLALGRRHQGHVLLPTSDDLAWMYSLNRDALARHFCLDLPPLASTYALLNKWRLYEACAAVDLDAPKTWLPDDAADVARIARQATFPLVIKPQTQVLLSPHRKGKVVRIADGLPELYTRFVASAHYAPMLLNEDPTASRFILQAYHKDSDGVYSLSGFIDVTGELFVVSASCKVLQRPLLTGVGVCFEAVEVIPELAERLRSLCRHVGYHGVFEAEFVRVGERHLLIDFNPRFFGQMGFDVARGVALPLLTYLAAVGDKRTLLAQLNQARQAAARTGDLVYVNRIQFEIYLRLLKLNGHLTRDDEQRWRNWLANHRHQASDAVFSKDDWLPAAVDVVGALIHNARHPRSALRSASSI